MHLNTLKRRVLPILRRHAVRKVGLFGSRARGTSHESSDVDLLVDLPSEMSLLDVVALKLELEDRLGLAVDLVEYAGLKPSLRDQILAEEIRFYG